MSCYEAAQQVFQQGPIGKYRQRKEQTPRITSWLFHIKVLGVQSCYEAAHLSRSPHRKIQTAKRTKTEISSWLFHTKALGVSNRKMSKTVKLKIYSDPPNGPSVINLTAFLKKRI
ncbi:hypothetical protein AVEN_68355-1 [Araneus ventricosus]|uniref:Uncharacterized protein n=1 Tax=Araneus ventricosus TaxID=182803 RepID=A0A4Y2W127_ARAVE|nr:hypothetical protein AVEN_68355-1 [Araneus ventricosus]